MDTKILEKIGLTKNEGLVYLALLKTGTSKTGEISTAQVVSAKDERDVVAISKHGQVIRLPLQTVSVLGRATQGVRVMRFKDEKDEIASVTVL